MLVAVGWFTEKNGLASNHPYFINLLSGATGFCFGIPVAGIVIREITRRANQSGGRRDAIRAVITQLDYLEGLVQRLSPGVIQDASNRLRHLAGASRAAGLTASASAKESSFRLLVGASSFTVSVRPTLNRELADKLRRTVESNRLWASVGFICGRLASDVSQLMAVLSQPEQSQGWLDELVGAMQTLLVIQLPVYRRWLPAAMKDPKAASAVVEVSNWSWTLLSSPEAKAIMASKGLSPEDDLSPEDGLTIL